MESKTVKKHNNNMISITILHIWIDPWIPIPILQMDKAKMKHNDNTEVDSDMKRFILLHYFAKTFN